MLPLKSCYMGFILFTTCSVLAHCALQPSMATDPFADNPEEKNDADSALSMHKRPSFFVGSRYGRSGVGGSGAVAPLFGSSKMRRLNVVPRNDRFFLGSRYGKRASEYMSPYEQDPVESSMTSAFAHSSGNKSAGSGDAPYMMSCVYTGLKNFYRCSSIEEINNVINQLTTAQNDDEEK